MKILFFKIGAIGDVLMTTPLIRQTRKNFPDAQIDYLVGNSASKVLINNNYINNVIKLDEKLFINKNIIKYLILINKIRKNKYDLIFVLDKHKAFNITAKLFGIKERIGFNRENEGKSLTKKVDYTQDKHEIIYYLDLLNTIKPADYNDIKLDIFTTEEDKKYAKDFFRKNNLRRPIGICPGGGVNPAQSLSEKIWPVENFIELIKQLSVGNQIVLIGGPTDQEVNDKIQKEISVLSTIGNTTLQQSAEIMRFCKLIICNDSGPMHLASAVNDNIISLFGPTNPNILAPLNKNSQYIWKETTPSYNIRGKISKNDNSINKISVEDIIIKVKKAS
nr:lipopolysaccharide heptosyltransferase II [Nanoarchaeum sp.]